MALTPFQNLDLPTVSLTIGPQWATDINTAFQVLDAHDHSPGKGARIPTSGLNINANLEFNGFAATELLSSKYESQAAALIGVSNVNSTYVVNGNLYYTNNSGNAVQITSGGSLATVPASTNSFESTNINSDLVINPADTFVYIFVDTTAARNITVPLSSTVTSGRFYKIVDISGNANTNNITITASGADTINGASTYTIDSDNASIELAADGNTSYHVS